MNAKPGFVTQDGNQFCKVSDIEGVVNMALKDIAPLWPISRFAARSPWLNLKTESFHEVALRMKENQGVDMYPTATIIRAANERGEIDTHHLEVSLQHWLDAHIKDDSFRSEAETYCRAVLSLNELPEGLDSTPGVKQAASAIPPDDLQTVQPLTAARGLQPLSVAFDELTNGDVTQRLNHHVIKWCKLYLDESDTMWHLPYRDSGFYAAFRKLVEKDPALPRSVRRRLQGWPTDAHFALAMALERLQINWDDSTAYLQGHLLALPGWAGMLQWRANQSEVQETLMVDYLAIRLSLEWALLAMHLPLPVDHRDPNMVGQLIAGWAYYGNLPEHMWRKLSREDRQARLWVAQQFTSLTARKLWLEAWEHTQSNRLQQVVLGEPDDEADCSDDADSARAGLSSHRVSSTGGSDPRGEHTDTPGAQFVFCIDVRSEPYRRRLEQSGPFETFGAAGFFGMPVSVRGLDSDFAHPSLPVILDPQHLIVEHASESVHVPYTNRRDALSSVPLTFKTLKQSFLGSLVLPDIAGFGMMLHMAARTFLPRSAGRAIQRLIHAWVKKPDTTLSVDSTHESDVGIPDDLKIAYVRQFLAGIGLTKDFAPMVVICGHESHTANNPYAAKLDCGACGGASGADNARILAMLCNQESVRLGLKELGIDIPEETVFVAAVHVTTTDTMRFPYVPSLSPVANQALTLVKRALPSVQRAAVAERLRDFPLMPKKREVSVREAERLAEDWSEVRPEWGLARNAAFIIGHRNLTKNKNLEGRVFLHSYDWRTDSEGEILDAILSGPGTVAEWINLQYYASTVDPGYYGAGSKATQTVTAGLGVMQGNGSDLLAGLPWQSVMKSDEEAYHAPLRLLVVIQAPRLRVKKVLEENPDFRQKVQNGWIRLATIDADGTWEDWEDGRATACENGDLAPVDRDYETKMTDPVFTS